MKKNGFLLFILFLIIGFSGCDFNNKINSFDQNPKPKKTLNAAGNDLEKFRKNELMVSTYDCISNPQNYEVGWLVKVIDGDSIEVEIDGSLFEVRYIGIDAPEYYSDEIAAAEISKAANQELLEGKRLYLYRDSSEKDKYGRLLRYVFTDQYFVNLVLVQKGYAQAKAYPPDTACQMLFSQYTR